MGFPKNVFKKHVHDMKLRALKVMSEVMRLLLVAVGDGYVIINKMMTDENLRLLRRRYRNLIIS